MSFERISPPVATVPDDCPTLHFPVPCPTCHCESGMPTKASTCPIGGVIVELRCRDCNHEWVCHLPAPHKAEARPKPDRRA